MIARYFVDAGSRLGHADRVLLSVSLLSFLAAPACSALAWRCALARRDGFVGRADAGARYGVGCLLNTLVPAHLGSGVRVALLTAALPRERRARAAAFCGGEVSLARTSATASLLAASLVPVAGAPICVAALLVLRGTTRWAFAAALVRVAAVACALGALGVGAPVATALVLVPAIELAGLVQLAPANAGVLTAVAAFVLARRGNADTVALGLALHAVETTAGVAFGLASVVTLAALRLRRSPVSSPGWRAFPFALRPSARSSSPA